MLPAASVASWPCCRTPLRFAFSDQPYPQLRPRRRQTQIIPVQLLGIALLPTTCLRRDYIMEAPDSVHPVHHNRRRKHLERLVSLSRSGTRNRPFILQPSHERRSFVQHQPAYTTHTRSLAFSQRTKLEAQHTNETHRNHQTINEYLCPVFSGLS